MSALTDKQRAAILRRLAALADGSATIYRKRPRNRVAVHLKDKAGYRRKRKAAR